MSKSTMSKDDHAIRVLIEERGLAVQEKVAEAAIGSLAEDVVMFDLAPPLVHKGAAARDPKALQEWMDGWEGPIKWSSRDLEVTVGSDVAYAHGLCKMSGKKKDGETVSLWFRSTIGLRKLDGEWEIAHEHNSVPFAMDGSFRALTDLTP
jgi:ketosteroid isomerase-like protein